MRRGQKLPRNMSQRVRNTINSLENAENITIDEVSDREFFVALHLFGVKQTSFQIEKRHGELKAINGDIAVPIESDEDVSEEIRDFAVGNPDGCNVQSRLEGNGQMCIISYKNRNYDDFIKALERFDLEYEKEFL